MGVTKKSHMPTLVLTRFYKCFERMLSPSLTRPMLGRWNRLDNVDIKATLANIDSCGDRLCGDVRETRAVIAKYQKLEHEARVDANVVHVRRHDV